LNRQTDAVRRNPSKRPLPTHGVADDFTPLDVKRGTLFVYVRRVQVPRDIANLGSPHGYWSFLPASARVKLELSITAAGMDFITAGSRIVSATAGFRWPEVYTRSIRRLLRSAAESRIHTLEVVNVDCSRNPVFYKVNIVAQPLAIRNSRVLEREQSILRLDTEEVA
jgi:hypothetical protein